MGNQNRFDQLYLECQSTVAAAAQRVAPTLAANVARMAGEADLSFEWLDGKGRRHFRMTFVHGDDQCTCTGLVVLNPASGHIMGGFSLTPMQHTVVHFMREFDWVDLGLIEDSGVLVHDLGLDLGGAWAVVTVARQS